MKEISNSLKNHLAGEVTSIAYLIRIRRKDGIVIGLTSHDVDIEIDSTVYKADNALVDIGFLQETTGRARDVEVTGVLESDLIAEEAIRAGLFDFARIDVFLCNWNDLTAGTMHVRRGWLGEVVLQDGAYKANFLPFNELLEKKVGEVYTPECRYDLGEARCSVDCNAYKVTGAVTSVVDSYSFTDDTRTEEANYFTNGKLTWTSGKNAGASVEVNRWDLEKRQFTLWLAPAYEIEVGDAYEVIAGCDKRFSTCKAKFNNSINYGGFPHLPGIGKLLQYPN